MARTEALGLFDESFNQLEKAMQIASRRQATISHNIANANTHGYQTIGVSFEEQLTDSLETPAKPVYQLESHQSSIDEQIALCVKNATQYRALIKGLNHKLAIMKLAVQGNKDS